MGSTTLPRGPGIRPRDRLVRPWGASSRGEVRGRGMIGGMPSRTDDPPRAGVGPRVEPAAGASTPPAVRTSAAAAEDARLTQESFRSVLSSHQRAGRWEPADEIEVSAMLDFTRAVLPPGGMVEIEARAVLGEVEIVVPDGAEVELDGTPILGSIEQHLRKPGVGEQVREWITGERDRAVATSDEPPYFHIRGRAILGSIRVRGR